MSDDELHMKLRVTLRANMRKEAANLAKLAKQVGSITSGNTPSHYVPSRGRGTAGLIPVFPSNRSQRSTVIARYTGNKLTGSWKAHGKYLARENAQEEGKQGLGFNAEKDNIDIATTVNDWQEAGDDCLWKIIVSPEFGGQLDLQVHVRELVARIEQDLHTPLEWVAVDHYNTDSPHVHLLLRGKDDQGKPLTIDRGYLRSGIRQRSGEVATRQLGDRGFQFDMVARQRQVTSPHFTALDKEILRDTKDNRYQLTTISYSEDGKSKRIQVIERLNYLQTLKLVSYDGDKTWTLAPNLQASLQENGILSTQLKIFDRHRPMLTDQNQTLQRTELKEPGQRLTGIVLSGGIDPETDKPYLLLEATDGKAHFLLQSPKIEASRLQDQLKDKTVITIKVKQFTSYEKQQPKTITYQHITEHGSQKEALIKRALLDKEILTGLARQQLPKCIPGNTGFASAFHEAVSKRCDQLEAKGMLMRMGDNIYITNQWASDYAAFRAEEVRQEYHITAAIKPCDKDSIIGKAVHVEPSILILQDIGGDYHYLSSHTERFINLEPGSTLLIKSANHLKEKMTLTTIDCSVVANEAKQEKLTVADTLLDIAIND